VVSTTRQTNIEIYIYINDHALYVVRYDDEDSCGFFNEGYFGIAYILLYRLVSGFFDCIKFIGFINAL
jgi:hypothetical protein